jgi:hypothetical protein
MNKQPKALDTEAFVSPLSRHGKLFIAAAVTPYGNEYGMLAVIAESRDEAIERARAALDAEQPGYVPHQQYLASLAEHLEETMREVEAGVVIDYPPDRG